MKSRIIVMAGIAICFAALPAICCAQAINDTGSSNCKLADFASTVQFLNGADHSYTILVRKQNISDHSCTFDGPRYGPSLVPDRVDGHEPVPLCYNCFETSSGHSSSSPHPTIDPGQAVLQMFRWKTVATGAEPCLPLKWMAGPVALVTPSLLKPVCSHVEVSEFTTAPANASNPPAFVLSSSKASYDIDEFFTLRLGLSSSSAASQPTNSQPANSQSTISQPTTCPTFYLWQRFPDGTTRLDEIQPPAFRDCPRHILGHEVEDWKSGFDLYSANIARDAGTGKQELQVFELTGSRDDPQLQFVASNVLEVEVLDPAKIARKWGPRQKGIAADVTLDKDTYRVGEDVPLHIAIKDFAADKALYSWDPVWDPCMAVSIRVLDSTGQEVPVDDRFPDRATCMGHGFGPRPFPKQHLVPIERSLKQQGWLPKHAGTFTVEVVWSPCANPKPQEVSADHWEFRTYAIARATAVIHIVADSSSQASQ